MAKGKDKKERREERVKKGMLKKLKPEKKLKKIKAVNEAGISVPMDESKHDTEGKLRKSGKNTLAKMKKKSKDKITSESENKEQISAKIKETAVSPVPTLDMLDTEQLKSEKLGKNASAKMKKKLKDKLIPKHKISSEADEEKISPNIGKTAVSPGDGLGTREELKNNRKKKLKKGKKKNKDQISKKQVIHSMPVEKDPEEKRSKESSVMDKDNAEEISSVDEDCSRGMKKWLMEYKESRPGIEILQQQIDDFISAHEAKLEQEKQEREAAAAEGGWTVVVHQKGRKKTTDAESGITVGSVAPAAVLDKMSKKKSKEVTMDFYQFQKREAQRNEIMMLQEKFEQDKKRIQQLRAARKFRPY